MHNETHKMGSLKIVCAGLRRTKSFAYAHILHIEDSFTLSRDHLYSAEDTTFERDVVHRLENSLNCLDAVWLEGSPFTAAIAFGSTGTRMKYFHGRKRKNSRGMPFNSSHSYMNAIKCHDPHAKPPFQRYCSQKVPTFIHSFSLGL